MIKKFFSIVLLATSLVVSSVFAKALTLKNSTSKEIINITFCYSTGRFNSNDVCSKILFSGEQGVSELKDIDTITVNKIHYTINTDNEKTEFTYDFHGKEIFLPATISLTDNVNTPIIIHDDENARVAAYAEAEKNKLLNQAAGLARNAKDTVENALVTAKDWATTTTKTITSTAQDVAHKAKVITNAAAQKIAEATSDVQTEGKELKESAEQKIQNATTTVKNVVTSAGEQIANVSQIVQNKASEMQDTTDKSTLEIKHAIQEKAQELGHSAMETALETYNTGTEIIDKANHKIEEINA